ncbi:unnamed protein product [Eruca vesicaria subsp. sativa]|uniref:RRM domain-containing protein n=1 Tax=Eruca vesicaria subsp. sativa TaxID=29727 RepID=A0ABC8LEE7_ERUVS|nr:unnamed protein product [Eruca vesicaria subsp. sativa]
MDVSTDKGLELNGGGTRNSRIIRMVVEGYDTSPYRDDIEDSLVEHFESRGIRLIHVSVPMNDSNLRSRRRALIYVNGECEAQALKLDGSYVGRHRILKITAYPFDDNSLEHLFPAPTSSIDENRRRSVKVTVFDTSLSLNDIEEMLLRVFPGFECFPHGNGVAVLAFCGPYAMDEVLKLSGGSVEGFNFAVTEVFSEIRMGTVGVSLADATRLGWFKDS